MAGACNRPQQQHPIVPSGVGAAMSDQSSAPDFGHKIYRPNGAEEITSWRNRELSHCRLALVGFLGAIAAEHATGLEVVEHWKFAGRAWRRTIAIPFFPDFEGNRPGPACCFLLLPAIVVVPLAALSCKYDNQPTGIWMLLLAVCCCCCGLLATVVVSLAAL